MNSCITCRKKKGKVEENANTVKQNSQFLVIRLSDLQISNETFIL